MRTYMWTSNISYCIFNVKPMLERSSRCKLDSFLVKVFSVLESLCILYPRTGDVSTALYRRQRLRNSTASGVALSNRAILFSVNHLELNNNTNNQQGNFQYQRGDQNNGNNENGNRNNRDNRNNDDHRPPTTNNRNDGPIGGTMTETRKAKLKEKGFLVAQGRYITFVHKFSGYNNKGKCKYFVYKGGACNKTDSGTCKFSHTNSFRSLPAQDKYALKAWVRNTPGVPFVDGRGPTNSSKYIITT